MKWSTSVSIVAASVGLLAGACDRAPADADNTARNRDPAPAAKSPMEQSNASEDVRITADIRRAIMDDEAMSVNAQNCKIITERSGVVTLRGPVESQSEKEAIVAKAKAVRGVTRVVNDLEVKTN